MEAEDRSRLLFEQIAVHGTGAHHNHLLLHAGALRGGGFQLLFRLGNLVIERNKPQIAALPRDQMVTEIEGQTDADHDDQVLANNVFLLDESLHTPNESHPSHGVKQKPEMNQHVVWVHLRNIPPNRFI